MPPLSERSAEFQDRVRAAAETQRLHQTAPWANQTLVGRGSAPRATDTRDPVAAELLRRIRAREAARRHLAENLVALPVARAHAPATPLGETTPPRTPGAAPLSPSVRLGDPGVLTAHQAERIEALIARAPVEEERELPGGRLEIQVVLPLDNIARILRNEPIIVTDRAAAAASIAADAMPPPSSDPASADTGPRHRIRSILPPPSPDEEMLFAPGDRDAAHSPSPTFSPSPGGIAPEARLETRRRAEARARHWLGETVLRKRLDDGTDIAHLAAVLVSVRQAIRERVNTAPVRSVVWDERGRCRVTLVLDGKALEAEIRALRSNPTSAPRSPAFPLP